MFEDSLMESGGLIRTKQKWTTTFSFLIQIVVIAFVALLPLIYTQVLPATQLNAFLVAPPPPPPPPPPAPQVQHVQRVSEIVHGELRTPSKIPKKIEKIVEDETPPDTGVIGGVVGGVPGGAAGGVIGGLIGAANTPPPKVAATPVQKLRVSAGVAEGNLLHRIEPQYPQMAKIAHIQGDVVLQATISKSGSIENLRSVSGHPMLLQAAMEAVKQWKYKPTLLNGEPVEVETSITVRFHM